MEGTIKSQHISGANEIKIITKKKKVDRNIAESIILIEPWLLCSFCTHKKQSNINGFDQMYVNVIYIIFGHLYSTEIKVKE